MDSFKAVWDSQHFFESSLILEYIQVLWHQTYNVWRMPSAGRENLKTVF